MLTLCAEGAPHEYEAERSSSHRHTCRGAARNQLAAYAVAVACMPRAVARPRGAVGVEGAHTKLVLRTSPLRRPASEASADGRQGRKRRRYNASVVQWVERNAHTAFPIIGIRLRHPTPRVLDTDSLSYRKQTCTRVQVGSIRCAHHVCLAHQHSARRAPSGHQRCVVGGAMSLQHGGARSGAHARRAEVVLHGQWDAVQRPQRLRRAAAGETGRLSSSQPVFHVVYAPVQRKAWDVWMLV